MPDVARPATRDIGWKQFTISVLDLVRWPVAVVVIFLLLRVPIEKLLDTVAMAVRS